MRALFIMVLSVAGVAACVLIAKSLYCRQVPPPVIERDTALPVSVPSSEKFILTGNYAAMEYAAFCTTYDTLIITRQDNSLYRIKRRSYLHLHAPGGETFMRRYISSLTASYDEPTGTLHCFPSGERGMVSAAYSEVVLGSLVYNKIE